MIIFVDEIRKADRRKKSKCKQYRINLRGLTQRGQVLVAVGSVLTTVSSPRITETSAMAGLVDVMSDFFYEFWGNKEIEIRGFDAVYRIDRNFGAEIVASIDWAFMLAIEAAARTGEKTDISEEIARNHIFIQSVNYA